MKNKAEREQLNYELKDTLAGALYYAWGRSVRWKTAG